MWQRTGLEYLFTKEPHLATVMSYIIARDIANKLYALNEKVLSLPFLRYTLESIHFLSCKGLEPFFYLPILYNREQI